MSDCVLDTSALLALLYGEPGHLVVSGFVTETGARMSAVNLSEVLTRLPEIGVPERETAAAVERLNLRVVAFDEPQARATALLRPVTRQAGLSLGDRACLALGRARGCPVVTADRVWATVDIGVEIILIR